MLEEIIWDRVNQAIIKRYNTLNIKPWLPVINKLLEIFGKTEKDVSEILGKYYLETSLEMKDIILFLINSFLKDTSKLLEGIIEIDTEEIHTPYYTKTRHVFRLLSKEDLILKQSSLWIYNHHQEVKDFMENDTVYNKLRTLENNYVEEND